MVPAKVWYLCYGYNINLITCVVDRSGAIQIGRRLRIQSSALPRTINDTTVNSSRTN